DRSDLVPNQLAEAVMATFELSPEVRWSDQDLLGHVNNARMITLIEECRVRWMHEIRAGHITGGGLLVARQTIDYLVPVMYGPALEAAGPVTRPVNSPVAGSTRGARAGQHVCDHGCVLVRSARAWRWWSETCCPSWSPRVTRTDSRS